MLDFLKNILRAPTVEKWNPEDPIFSSPYGFGRILPQWNHATAIEAYQTNPWVYACVRLIASETARAHLRLFQMKNGKPEEVTDHPAMQLLANPNEYSSGYEFIEGLQTWLELTGESPVYLNLGPNNAFEPLELFQLDPRFLTIIGDRKKYIDGFIYRPLGGGEQQFTPEQIILFRDFNPASEFRGHPPIRSARYAIDSDTYAEKWNAKFFANDAVPRAVVTTQQQLDDKVYKRVRETWDAIFKGTDNAHKTSILEGGLDVKLLQQTAKDMDFALLGDKNRDRICAAFRVPKALLGIEESGAGLAKAGVESMVYSFARFTIGPKLRHIEAKLNNELLPLFKIQPGTLFFKFDDPAMSTQTERLARYQALFQLGALSPNEIRSEEGLPEVDGGEEPLISAGLVPLSQADALLTPDPSSDQAAADAAAVDGATEKAVATPELRAVKVDGQARELLRSARTVKIMRRERLYQARSRSLFKVQFNSVKKALSDYYSRQPEGTVSRAPSADDIFNERENVVLTVKLFEPLNQKTIATGGEDQLDLLESDQDFNFERARVAAKNMTLNFAKDITATTKKKLRAALDEGIANGEGVYDLTDRVQNVFKEASTSRAVTIARTETTKAYNMGGKEGMRQAGVEKKSWLTANDKDVRDTHTACEAQGAIGLDMSFSNGCDFPGDPDGDPDEVINCRCTLLPEVDE